MKVDPITVAASRIASLASQGRGITVEEAENYIRGECGDVAALLSIVQWAYDYGHTPPSMSREDHQKLALRG